MTIAEVCRDLRNLTKEKIFHVSKNCSKFGLRNVCLTLLDTNEDNILVSRALFNGGRERVLEARLLRTVRGI